MLPANYRFVKNLPFRFSRRKENAILKRTMAVAAVYCTLSRAFALGKSACSFGI
jgi:hypothetical protein